MPDGDPVYLPRADEAEIEDAKLRDYALNPDHTVGGPKARVFRAALGFERADWRLLREQILARVGATPVSEIRQRSETRTGYVVIIPVEGPNGQTRPVLTAWIVEDDGPPRLTSAYLATGRWLR